METAAIQSILLEHSPIRRGHFLLSSGMHSSHFVELEPIVQDPRLVSTVAGAIAERFREQQPQVVLAALGPGAIVGYELAKQLGARAIYADGPVGQRSLGPAFQVIPNEPVLIVMGVIVTGESARELMRQVTLRGGRVVGVAALVDRSEVLLHLGVPFEALAVVDLESYLAPVCPLCAQGEPLERRSE